MKDYRGLIGLVLEFVSLALRLLCGRKLALSLWKANSSNLHTISSEATLISFFLIVAKMAFTGVIYFISVDCPVLFEFTGKLALKVGFPTSWTSDPSMFMLSLPNLLSWVRLPLGSVTGKGETSKLLKVVRICALENTYNKLFLVEATLVDCFET